ncbi:MAG: hypothetical protein QM617_09120 [Comamonas sp.]
MIQSFDQLARAAHEAYAHAEEKRTGTPQPFWRQLHPAEQDSWKAVAMKVVERIASAL